MNIYGNAVFDSLAIGKIQIFERKPKNSDLNTFTDSENELNRFFHAVEIAKEQLTIICNIKKELLQNNVADIFSIHNMILEDIEFINSVTSSITENKFSAAKAVSEYYQTISEKILLSNDDFFISRLVDIEDICNRIIDILHLNQKMISIDHPVIIMTDNLMPSEIVSLDRKNIIAVIAQSMSPNSHSAELLRIMQIPTITNIAFSPDFDGMQAIIDGSNNLLIINPDDKTILDYKEQQQSTKQNNNDYLIELSDTTKDNKAIPIYANICDASDIDLVNRYNAQGVGLYRTEFIYLQSDSLPTEEFQFRKYRDIVSSLSRKSLTIRTMDLGADKKLPYMVAMYEKASAELTSIQFCLLNPELLKTQLRAIYRASVYGTIKVMFPMISTLEEVLSLKSIVNEVTHSLTKEKIPYKNIEIGIMVETKNAMEISDTLAREVDFFSIGTNDLSKDLFNLDRLNPELDDLYKTKPEELFNAIETIVHNAHKHNISVSVCGEIASDPTMTEKLIQAGVDELSVNPPMILTIRKSIRESIYDTKI